MARKATAVENVGTATSAKPNGKAKKAAQPVPIPTDMGSCQNWLPKRGDGGASVRAAMMSKLSTIKEDQDTIIPNDFVERSFPTESIVINNVLGIKEIPMHGRMVQVHGEEHTGKSTLLYTFAAAYQKVWGRPVMVWDLEGQLVPEYLWNCGMNPDPAFTQLRMPTDINDVLRITCEHLLDKTVDYFIFDSVAWLLPETTMKEIRANKALNFTVGEQAKLVKKFLQILVPRARRADAALHFVNQQSAIIPQNTKEAMAMKYASITSWNHTITGGKAARYTPSLMLVTAKGKAFEGAGDDEEWLFPTGEGKAGAGRSWDVNKTQLRIVKNKINDGGYREYCIYIRPGGGIDDWISVRELAKHYDLISKISGGYAVGKVECPLATFKTKAQAIDALVLRQDMSLLLPLRALTVDAIEADNPRAFIYERSQEDKFAAGETDVAGKPVEVDDFLGDDEEDDLPPVI